MYKRETYFFFNVEKSSLESSNKSTRIFSIKFESPHFLHVMVEIGTKIWITSAVESWVNKYTCKSDSGGDKSIVTHSPFSISCSVKGMKPTARMWEV